MQKITWLDINSSYSHSSLALPAIEAQQANNDSLRWSVVHGTINSVISTVIEELVEQKPDIIAYTAWLFNHDYLLQILARYAALNPAVMIIGGGPEYLGCNEAYLRKNPFVNYLVRGEGEQVFYELLSGNLKAKGICYLDNGVYHDNGIAKVEDFAALHYPEESQFFDWTKPFVQIESTRGCFNQCSFCVSGADKPVRALSVEALRARLINVKEHGIRDIRLLDRTFNGKGKRTLDMLDLFSELSDSMRFHLEVHPALFTPEIRSRISAMPKGALHLEAGVQSLSQEVLDGVTRFGDVNDVISGLRFLSELDNMELHSDLIAGLPYYTLSMMYDDVNTLAEIGCEEIQLELLKLLPGTSLCSNTSIVSSPLPPYEVMRTEWMSYAEMQEARRLSRTLDIYYNTWQWHSTTRELIAHDPNFIRQLTHHMTEIGVIDTPMSQEKRGIILYEYCMQHHPQFLVSVTLSWLKAGLSLRKGAGAAAQLHRGTPPAGVAPQEKDSRLYHLSINNTTIWVTYNKSISLSYPVDIFVEA